jgi:hypothetical protein
MYYRNPRVTQNSFSISPQAPAKVDVLVIEKVVFIEPIYGLKVLYSHKYKHSSHPIRLKGRAILWGHKPAL